MKMDEITIVEDHKHPGIRIIFAKFSPKPLKLPQIKQKTTEKIRFTEKLIKIEKLFHKIKKTQRYS